MPKLSGLTALDARRNALTSLPNQLLSLRSRSASRHGAAVVGEGADAGPQPRPQSWRKERVQLGTDPGRRRGVNLGGQLALQQGS